MLTFEATLMPNVAFLRQLWMLWSATLSSVLSGTICSGSHNDTVIVLPLDITC